MNETDNEEQKKGLGEELKDQAQHQIENKGKQIAGNALKQGAMAAGKALIAGIQGLIGAVAVILPALVPALIVLAILGGCLFVIHLGISEKVTEATLDSIEKYCSIDERGIHFDKEAMKVAIEVELKNQGIDLNDLGFGNTKTKAEEQEGEQEPEDEEKVYEKVGDWDSLIHRCVSNARLTENELLHLANDSIKSDKYNEDTIKTAVDKAKGLLWSEAGEKLYNLMTASMTTEFPYIEGSDKEAKGIIKIKRQSDQTSEPTELKYIGYKRFQNILQGNNRNEKEKLKEYYSIDEQWNLCIVKVHRETVDGQETQYIFSEVKIPYRTMVSQYSVSFNFLMSLQLVTNNIDYVEAVADLIKNQGEIEFTIFDSITTTTEIYTYKYSTMKKWVSTTTTTVGHGQTAQTVTKEKKHRSGPTEQPDKVTTTIIEEDTIKANVTKAKVWVVDQETKYECEQKPREYPLGEEGQTTPIDDETEPPGDEGSWRVDQSENTTTFVDAYEWVKSGEAITQINPLLFLGLWKNDTGTYAEGAEYNPKGKVVAYNGDRPVMNILTSEQWLYDLLQNDEKTQVQAEILQYLIHLYRTGEEIDISHLFSLFEPSEFTELNSIVGGDFVVKTDDPSAAPTITDKAEFKKAIQKWLKTSTRMRDNALRVSDLLIDLQEEYKVNAIFVLSMLRNETGIGTANSSFVNQKNNWMSWNLSQTYSSPEENIKTAVSKIATGNIYFKQGLTSVHTIGAKYCADPPAPKWGQVVVDYMNDFYDISGISVGEGIEDVITNNTTYKVGSKLYINYKQGDYKQKDILYSATGNWGTIAANGCMPTSIAIIASGYGKTSSTGQIYTPRTIITDKILPHTSSYSTAVIAFQKLGLKMGPQTNTSIAGAKADMIQHLKAGKPILMHAKRGYYTGGGHYLTLLGVNAAGEVYLSNSGSKTKTGYINLDLLISRNVDWYAKIDV